MGNENNRFSMLSPLDHRYYFANKALFEKLAHYFSEEAVIKYNLSVEIALLKTIAPYCNISQDILQQAEQQANTIAPQEVLEEEEKTRHNIRAVVNVLKRHVPPEVSQYIHLGATSFDISDTAASLRLKDACNNVIIPLLIQVEEALISIAETHIHTPQVGRTHGQFAVPITIGHMFAEYISRLGNSIITMTEFNQKIAGKLSGAVGAYNALSLIAPDPIALEKQHLQSLGLQQSEYSNQVCAPEPVLRLLLEMNVAFGIIANLADDLRNLQRSEIGELSEFFDETHQVGSSTMPQKRNPWNSEHIKSLYKVFSPRVLTFYQDQITEHQRDLTNSASQRFIAEYVGGFSAAVNRTLKVLQGLQIHDDALQKNLHIAGDSVLAEAAYILLALSGYDNAHEIVRQASITMHTKQCSIIEALGEEDALWDNLERQLQKLQYPTAKEFFSSATNYIGQSVTRTELIIQTHIKHLNTIKDNITQ